MGEFSTSLFSPDGVELRDAAQVERALTDLWQPAAKATGLSEPEAVTRVCLANLVVVALEDSWNDLLKDLSELSPVYPTRTIVLLLKPPGAGKSEVCLHGPKPGVEVRASVSALCHVPRPGRPQICSEQIILRSRCTGACDLDRTLLTMLEADVPTVVWWTFDPGSCSALFSGLRRLSDRLVLDAGMAGLAILPEAKKCEESCAIRELGWVRTYRLRQFIAAMFDECGAEPLTRITNVTIALQQPDVADRIDSLWITAFLAAQLDWHPQRRVGESTWEFTGQNKAHTIPVSMTTEAGAQNGIRSLHIHAAESTFDIQRCDARSDEYRTIICDAHACRMPRSIQIPRLPRSDAMAAAMRGRPIDLAFTRAAPIAHWLTFS